MTLTDRVVSLEQQVATNQATIQTGMDAMRQEFQQLQNDLKENFELLMRSWETQERDRKEKGVAIANSSGKSV